MSQSDTTPRQVAKTEEEWRAELTPGAVRHPAPWRHRARLHGQVLGRPRRRRLPLRRLRRRALQLRDQVRLRLGLAELHRADVRRRRRDPRGPLPLHDPHRGRVQALRWAPRPRLRRRAGRRGRPALLHQQLLAGSRREELAAGFERRKTRIERVPGLRGRVSNM